MATAHDVAAYILDKLGPMSTMKLQKLVYYSQAWHLVWVEDALFTERIEAWANGPVTTALYNFHRGRFRVERWPQGDSGDLNATEKGTVDAVISTYGHLDGRKLSYLTHAEQPWREARGDLRPTDLSHTEITRDSMQIYYSGLESDDKATPIDEFDWGTWDDDNGPTPASL